MKRKIIAIDIGNKTTKIAYGVKSKKNILLSEYAIIDTPINCIKDGTIVNVQDLALNISVALKNLKIRSGELVLNITGTSVITREIQVPISTDDEILQMLEFEAQQYFPVDLLNYTLDFKLLENVTVGETMQSKLLLVAAPNKQLEEYILLSKLLKLQLLAIDTPANCMLKLIRINQEIDNGEYAVINIGLETTEVCIFNKDCMKFSRILLNGSGDIDRLIANSFNISLQKAEELKVKYNNLSNIDNNSPYKLEDTNVVSEQAFLSETIDNALNNIVSDINRFIEFYNSRDNSNRVSSLFICGGGSRLSGLCHFFASYFNMTVKIIPISNNVIYKGKKPINEFERDYPLIVNALGGLIRM